MGRDLRTHIPDVPHGHSYSHETKRFEKDPEYGPYVHEHREYPKHVTVGGTIFTVDSAEEEKELLGGVAPVKKPEAPAKGLMALIPGMNKEEEKK